jgi:adenylate cyclase
MAFRETEMVLFTADLAGYARASAQLPPLQVAAALADWYRSLEAVIGARGGRIVKFMGDACLATFPAEASSAAVEAATELVELPPVAGLNVRVGVRVHAGVVAEGEVGADHRYDIFGSAVNDLFLMGRAGSLLISEPIFHRLPDAEREAWQRQAAPAIYARAQRPSTSS